jgi:hypothetical protein
MSPGLYFGSWSPQRHGMPSCVLAAGQSTGAISHEGDFGELEVAEAGQRPMSHGKSRPRTRSAQTKALNRGPGGVVSPAATGPATQEPWNVSATDT